MKSLGFTLLCLTASTAILAGADWPQWRGPQLNGVSAEAGLPRTWSPTENIGWKLPTPSRTGSTPIISGNTLFLNLATADFTGDLELWAEEVIRRPHDLAS